MGETAVRIAISILFLCSACFGQGLRDAQFLALSVESNPGPAWVPPPPAPTASESYTTNIIAYYACEDVASHQKASDSSGNGYDIPTYFGDNSYPVAGKIGNGFNLDPDGFRKTGETHLDFSGIDFCIRLWFNPTHADDIRLIARGSPTFWELEYTPGISNQELRWIVPGIAGVNYTNSVSLNNWHRVFVWVKAGVEIGIKVDNETSVVTTNSATMTSVPSAYFILDPASYEIDIDEIAIWKGYVLTEDDLAYDWNSGAGRGKPE